MSSLRSNRRRFLTQCTAAAVAATAGSRCLSAVAAEQTPQIGAFIKFIQQMSYADMAAKLAEFGFTGVEATVRKGGLIPPEKVEDELPKFVEALDTHGLKIHVMASDVKRADDPLAQRVLKTAARVGVRRYRMSYYRYDLNRPIRPQLDNFAPMLKDLVQVNAELGLQAVYQNHAGKQFVGGTIWDIEQLVRAHSKEHVAIAFDIRHATAEAGVSWPTLFRVAEPHLGAIYVKDFRWNGPKPENVPLGQGRVDQSFFELVKKSTFNGPFSLHVEYLGNEGLAPNLQALKDDLATLNSWLA